MSLNSLIPMLTAGVLNSSAKKQTLFVLSNVDV